MQWLRQLGWGVVLGAAVMLSGCSCTENKKAGVPQITCQPVDQTVYLRGDGRQDVSFHTEVRERNCRYEWYCLQVAEKVCTPVSLAEQPGGQSATLVLTNINESSKGFYYCEIIHEAEGGLGEVSSRSRVAELKVYPMARSSSLSRSEEHTSEPQSPC